MNIPRPPGMELRVGVDFYDGGKSNNKKIPARSLNYNTAEATSLSNETTLIVMNMASKKMK